MTSYVNFGMSSYFHLLRIGNDVRAGVPIHGFAVMECPSPEQALEVASRLLRLHQEFVPDWEVDCDVREIVTHCLP